MTTWPTTLPQSFLIDGFSEEGSDNVIRSPVDAGPAKTRRRYTAATRPIKGRMLLTHEQYLVFKEFYEETINDGATEFDMPDDIHDTTMTVKFKDKYQSEYVGRFWVIDLNLERQP